MEDIDLEDYVRRVNENEDSAIKLIEINKELLDIVENQKGEIEHLQETIREIEQDRDENYKPRWRDKYEEYGISEKDFH